MNKAVFGGGGNSRGCTGGSGEEPVDERLKGIEPKMIELVMNEVYQLQYFIDCILILIQIIISSIIF